MMSFICGIQKETIQMNLQNRKRLTDLENELMIASGEMMKGRDSQGVWGQHVHTAVFKMDNKQCPTVQHSKLLNVVWQPGWEGSLGGEWIHVYVWLNPFIVH